MNTNYKLVGAFLHLQETGVKTDDQNRLQV